MTILFGIFLILHGMVHLLYAGQSSRLFELQPGMILPDGSWLFSRPLGDEATRLLATVFLILAAIGFAAGGLGIFIRQAWWRPVILGAAIFSSMLYLILWDGKFQALPDKGGVGILINIAILVLILVFKWPA